MDRPAQSIDSHWFQEFHQLGTFSDISYLVLEEKYLKEQEDLFISEKLENPQLRYWDLESFDINQLKEALLHLNERIGSQEPNEFVRLAYQRKVEERLEVLTLLSFAKARADEKFSQQSEKIYGTVTKEILAQSIYNLEEYLEKPLRAKNKAVKGAAMRVMEAFEKFSVRPKKSYDFPLYEQDRRRGKRSRYGARSIRRAFKKSLRKQGIKEWDVNISKSHLNISVNHRHKLIKVPEGRKIDARGLQALISHEVGTHILRGHNGLQSPLQLLSLGLDYYFLLEEGLALHREFNASGVERRLGVMDVAIAMARGVAIKAKNFREIYEILNDYYFAVNVYSKAGKRVHRAHDKAWRQTLRVFRGTTAQQKGYCFTRNVVYHSGLLKIREYLTQHPEKEDLLLQGKYDPTNEEHIRILQGLGMNV
ncbi:MAG: DUF1704 domain-containing protein [Candidatus Harrisonbacteria bacterium]|nr:DUF1704 domain-containing protein [Candidatus Harrisonbacteria bacterium]